MLGFNLIGDPSFITEGIAMEHDSEEVFLVERKGKKRPRHIFLGVRVWKRE